MFDEISNKLSGITWPEGRRSKIPDLFDNLCPVEDSWPMSGHLKNLFNPVDKNGNLLKHPHVGDHVLGVIASVNSLLDGRFTFATKSNSEEISDVKKSLDKLFYFCFHEISTRERERNYIKGLLRISALYHDIGKLISNDRHVSRGVHFMRDMTEADRKSFENNLFRGLYDDKHYFWSLLRHHDIFGCLCTGEASLPAIFEMVRWSSLKTENIPDYKSVTAYISYLVLLNIADSDSSLFFNKNTQHIGLPEIEGLRYLSDWELIKDYLWQEIQLKDRYLKREKIIMREEFISWLLEISSHPQYTIQRITRLVVTAYVMCLKEEELPDAEISNLVEDELQALHGTRIGNFCFTFTRFCKIDYGLRFFQVLMLHELLESKDNLLERTDSDEAPYKFPASYKLKDNLSKDEKYELKKKCLTGMVHRTCQILKGIVDDYGHLVNADSSTSPLLCIIMEGVMPENQKDTAWAICRAFKENSSRALGWISDEVGVGLYGE